MDGFELRHLAPGHRTDYQRVLSRAPWSGLALGCAVMRFVLDHLLPAGPVMLVGDDTVDGHKGKCVYGKARHRDAVRSSHSYTAWRYGHKWVVLAEAGVDVLALGKRPKSDAHT